MLKLFDKIVDYVFVPKCGGCGTRMDKTEIGICKRCKNRYDDERAEYCETCGMEVSICACIPPNLLINGCYDYRKLIFYKSSGEDTPIRRMIYGVKRGYNLALIKFFAKELLDINKDAPLDDVIVTFAPRTKKAVKEYGYDQSKLLAKWYAKYGEYPFEKLIRRKRSTKRKEQKALKYNQRLKNVKGAFEVCNSHKVYGKTVVIIDDVVTSGATVGECADLLYSVGAKNVICRSIAYTYRNNKRKKD